MDAMGVRFNPISDKYISLLFDNADSNYAEVPILAAWFLRPINLETCTDQKYCSKRSLSHRKEQMAPIVPLSGCTVDFL